MIKRQRFSMANSSRCAAPGSLVGPEDNKCKGNLNLQGGDWVDVKNAEEIRPTLNPEGINCGLAFRPSMASAIGGRFQVAFLSKISCLSKVARWYIGLILSR